MSYTTTANLSLIPDIEAFEERVAIMVHDGGIPTYIAMDLAAQAPGLPQSGALLGLAQGLCGTEKIGLGSAHIHLRLSPSGDWAKNYITLIVSTLIFQL